MDEKEFLQKLTAWHQARFPETVALRKVGQEKEFPVIDAVTHQAVDARVIFPDLLALGWQPKFDDYHRDLLLGVYEPELKVEITTEAGYCTLEIIMPPAQYIGTAISQFQTVQQLVVNLASKHHLLLLGYGIQPLTGLDDRLWIAKRRHQKIRFALPKEVDAVCITASDQVHLDICRYEVLDAVNVFNALSGLIIHLFANSPIWKGKVDRLGRLAVRESLWSFAPRNRRAIPAGPYLDYETYIRSQANLTQLLCKENGDYQLPNQSYLDYVLANPQTDWQYHWMLLEGMNWPNARVRTPYATVEIRPACSNDLASTAALTAFTLGVLENLAEVKSWLMAMPWQSWMGRRRQAISGLVDYNGYSLLEEVLLLAKKGLLKRVKGEEKYLDILFERVSRKTNPAQQAIATLEKKGWGAFIQSIAL